MERHATQEIGSPGNGMIEWLDISFLGDAVEHLERVIVLVASKTEASVLTGEICETGICSLIK